MILDCDTGHDDAVALMLAGSNENIDLVGVTVVAGNMRLERTLPNTLFVCQHTGIDVDVYGGMTLPLIRDQVTAPEIHGVSGLDGARFENITKQPGDKHAVQYLIDTLMASDGDITLVPVAPLTNIAMAIRMEPRIVDKIKEIVLMGGSVGLGNTTASAEFNIYADPEAAYIVFTSGIKITMMGLDITRTAIATEEVIQRIEKIGNNASRLFADILRVAYEKQKDNGMGGVPVHDVCAVCYLIAPQIYTTKDMYVQVDINHGPCYGRTICDYYGQSGKPANVTVGLAVDLDKFWDIVAQSIAKLK